MDHLTILPCVPQALADLAPKAEMGCDAGRRLLTDNRMTLAWREIAKEAERQQDEAPDVLKSRLAQLDHLICPETWNPLVSMNLSEQAICSIYLGVCLEYARQLRAVRKTALEREIDSWRQGAALCREAREIPHRAGVDPGLRMALEQVEAYFDGWAEFIETAKEGPAVIARGKKVVDATDDDANNMRVRTRAVALRFQSILETTLYGTVATAMNVAFGYKVTAGEVENWSRPPNNNNDC